MTIDIEVTSSNAQWIASLSTPVAVLMGGESAEREVSLASGQAILAALIKQGVRAEAVDTAEAGWMQQVADHYAHCFIALHGVGGEDGTVQGALETMGVSYTGSGVLASALAMDKYRTKQLWLGMNFPTPSFERLTSQSDWQGIIERWGDVIVKPAREGSSIGMARANNAEQLKKAYTSASRYDEVVLAEQWVVGREFTVAVLEDKALPAIGLETENSFYDFDAKYVSNDTRYLCPCGLSEDKEQVLQQLALEAFRSVGCQGWGRIDFMQNENGDFFALEINTVPGMTSHSLVPMAAKSVGLDFESLVLKILQLSVNTES